MEKTNANSVNKKRLFEEIIKGYYSKINEGTYQDTIDTYLGSIAKEYNKKYAESFPKHIKEDEREELLVYSNMDKTKAVFFDAILQVDVENIKTEEMNELPLSNFEDELIGILDAYCYLENERAAHRIIVNPMNVFGSIMYQGFANERMDKKLIEGFRYSSYEILSFYYYESKGYRRIIEKVFSKYIIDSFVDRGFSLSEKQIKVEQSQNNQYLFSITHPSDENTLNIQCIFKDGYYQYWNDNDDRYISDFNIDLIVPDYQDFLTK